MPSLDKPNFSLQTLKNALGDTRCPKLTDERFDQAHERFERSSTQQSLILQWLINFASGFPKDGLLEILSVGCGSGILDIPLIQAIAAEQRAVNYVGIDPNPFACERFRQEFDRDRAEGVELVVREETVETMTGDQRFDIVHAVHSLYYFQDPAASIQQLIDRLSDNGKLVIFQAPKAELNQLADCFWFHDHDVDIWFSEQLEEHLDGSGYRFTRSSIDGRVDVTSCFDPSSEKGALILDFITHVDGLKLSVTAREHLLGYLKEIAQIDGDKLTVPHPVNVFTITTT